MKNVKMVLTNGFGPDVRVYKEAKYLAEKGFDVEILCWDRQNEHVDLETEEIDGIKIKRFFPYSKYGTGLKQLSSFIQFIEECRRYLDGKKYRYLHCHDLDGVIVGYFVRRNNAKLIFDMHEIYEVNRGKQKFRHVIRWIVNYFQSKSDYIIFLNDFQRKIMLKRNTEKLIFLPNYPEKKDYSNYKKTKSDKLRISYIGAVRQYMQLKNLMDACKDLKDTYVSVHGSGVDMEKLKAIEKDYNNVQVTGRFSFKDSAKLYSECDLLYALYPMTSLQYVVAVPVKFYEAIITKTPMIVNNNKSLCDFVIENDIGFVVNGDNVEDIRNLIYYILNNRHILKEKMTNLSKIQYKYSWDDVVGNLDIIYN